LLAADAGTGDDRTHDVVGKKLVETGFSYQPPPHDTPSTKNFLHDPSQF